MKSENGNLWDGFDDKQYVYDEKKEKHYQATVWIILALISGAVFLYVLTDHIKELHLVHNGNFVEASYDEDTMIAKCFDADGKWHAYDLSNYYPVVENRHVLLYYWQDIDSAKPENTLMSRMIYYIFFGVIFGVSIWRIVKVYHVKRH